jgi:hypothetical protein
MSAEIIDFCAWRREHRAPEATSVSVPVLLPTWPWGWLLPSLVDLDLGILTDSPAPPRESADQANIAKLSHHNNWQSSAASRERRATATTDRLYLVSSSKGRENRDL